MGFIARLKALTGTPAVIDTIHSRQNNLIPSLGGSNRTQQQIQAAFARAQSAGYYWMYANSPAVRTVVDLITRNAAQLDLRLYEELDEAERKPAYDHPAAVSLRHPSDTQTSDQWVSAMFQDYLVFGNAYTLKFRVANAQRLVLKVIPAHRMEIIGDRLFDPEAYRVTRMDGSQVVIEDPSDVIHWHGYNPDDPRLGLSPLETLRNVVAEDAALQAAIVELAKSGLAQPTWVSRPLEAPPWSNDARKGFEEDLHNRLKRSNAFPPVMEEGMELRPFGVSPQEAEMLEVRKWAIQQVASQYGVPLGMVGLDDDVESARSEFYADTLPPYCESFTRQLNLSVLRDEYGLDDYCFEFDLDEKHMGDERLSALVSATGRPVMTTNEGRAKLNLPKIDGGDELVTPANVIVGENPKPSTDIMPIQDPNGPAQDGSHREEPKQLAKATPTLEPWQPRMTGDLSRQHRYIDEVAGKLERYYARQYGSLTRKADVKFDGERWNRELSDDLRGLVRGIVEREGNLYVARLMGDEFDMRQVENYLESMADGTARAINRVTREDIDSMGVEAALARARGERAESAAASIGTRATVFAREQAAKQSPHRERRTKTWIANTDRHSGLNGATVALDSSFGRISPGSEPGCKCSVSIT